MKVIPEMSDVHYIRYLRLYYINQYHLTRELNFFIISCPYQGTIKQVLWGVRVVLIWCLTPLSTLFQLYRGG
jgi:hypothetical protein